MLWLLLQTPYGQKFIWVCSRRLTRYLAVDRSYATVLPQMPSSRCCCLRRIAMMREGAFVINVSRGGLLDTDAAIDALESGQIGCLCVSAPAPLPRA